MDSLDDTIVAIGSPPGGAARGIVRISGPQALDCLGPLFRPDDGRPLGPPRFAQAIAGSLHLPGLHSPLPCEAYVWPEGRSYTGQAVVEIHTFGSPPLLQTVLRSICIAGARLAGPGEFTLRAFLAGRINLTQAEAVLGVIDAGDAHELDVALAQLAGGLARPLSRLRDALVDLLAHVEAGFDFADEELAFITGEDLDRQLAAACRELAAIRQQVASRNESTDAVRAVLVGRPNTGKSSLFNCLAGNSAALVSEHPGTTRDYLIAELDLDGVKCRLVDTAGTGNGGPAARGEGRGTGDERQERTSELDDIQEAAESAAAGQRRAAHVQVLCLDATRTLDAWERSQLARAAEAQRIVVLTKCDARWQTDCPHVALETSSVTQQGMAALRGNCAGWRLPRGKIAATWSPARRFAVPNRSAWPPTASGGAGQVAAARQEELAAAEMRTALEELDKVVGAVYTEDVLDRIFSRFCIGK